MAYADKEMSSSRITAIVIVALLHALLGYALVTGLAYNVVKKMAKDLKTFNVEERNKFDTKTVVVFAKNQSDGKLKAVDVKFE